MPGVKTNEREGTRAVLKYSRTSPYKVRVVLNLIRGQHVQRAAEILKFSERDAAQIVGKLLDSAVANAQNNDQIDPEELYVSACFADEGPTLKRFRPRARGRAGKIRKRTSHVTVIVSRMPDAELRRFRAKQSADLAAQRARRVAGGRGTPTATAATRAERGRRFGRGRRTDEPTTETPTGAVAMDATEGSAEEPIIEETVAPDIATTGIETPAVDSTDDDVVTDTDEEKS